MILEENISYQKIFLYSNAEINRPEWQELVFLKVIKKLSSALGWSQNIQVERCLCQVLIIAVAERIEIQRSQGFPG